MQIGEKLYGFAVKDKKFINEIGADVYIMEFIKNGARLLYLDRDEDNKTFSISFKTVPTDSTGVFHIIEHSVLCGSEKFPVKDPFVELLKGSLNTFLNAITFQDKTMYPVASRNDKDFYNLVEIYLDAVFAPTVVKDKKAFLQEGWHYEIEEDGSLNYKGVVLNEMRGDYSSADTVSDRLMNEMLYPTSCYGYDSGGDPSEIVKLTYEQFKDTHARYYHPTNSYVFLDGAVKLDEILPLIASYLDRYERAELPAADFDIPTEDATRAPEKRSTVYEIAPGETTENKARMALGFPASSYSERRRNYALGILYGTLLSTNESEIKKAIVNSGLCEDISVSIHDGILAPSVSIDFINILDGREEELRRLFFDTVSDIGKRGIDREQLSASINSCEFKMREKDFGTFPLGLVYAIISLESNLYSDDPVLNYSFEEDYEALRKELSGRYFEELMLDVFSEENCKATLYMTPSATLGAERAEKERLELEAILKGLTKEEIEQIKRTASELEAWQAAPDADEAMATIPKLTLEDIPATVRRTPEEVATVDGVTVIKHPLSTAGIVYADLFFDITDVEKEELPYWYLLCSLLTNLKTAEHSAASLQSLIKSELGSLSATVTSIARHKEGGLDNRIYLNVSVSVLKSKCPSVAKILDEVLYSTLFEEREAVRNIIKQIVISNEESFVAAGHRAALARAQASASVEGAVGEYFSGYESHRVIKALSQSFDEKYPEMIKRISALLPDALDKARLTVSITGEADEEFVRSLIAIPKKCEKGAPVCKIEPMPVVNEGIIIPSRVSYAVRASNLFKLGYGIIGEYDAIRCLLGFEYLWSEVRVKGGAYGSGMVCGISGNVGFYSYRDPTPKRSLGCYLDISDFLVKLADEDPDLTKFIIGAVGDAEPVVTPRTAGYTATVRFLRGIDHEKRALLRRELLATDRQSLLRAAELVRAVNEAGAICVFGNKESLSEMPELERILEL